jgi:hypothetical protein
MILTMKFFPVDATISSEPLIWLDLQIRNDFIAPRQFVGAKLEVIP